MAAQTPSPSHGWQRPSIYDVARRAGVSHMTVSRVLNDHPSLRETTRTRVLQAIDEMDYTPSSIARALVTRRFRRIGVLVDGFAESGPNSTLRALERAARGAGYAVSAISIDDDSLQLDTRVRELVGQGVDALCVVAPRASSLQLLHQRASGLPLVVISAAADAAVHTVGVDQREGARLCVQHLIDLGHRIIAHATGPLDCVDARERERGWRECLAEAGLTPGPLGAGDWTADFGFAFGRSSGVNGATAVFAANDRIALGVIHGLHSRGIRVPQDVSVVGFDDMPDARHFLPPLTTVQQDFVALGERALQRIIAAVEGEAQPGHDRIAPQLVVRASTAPFEN